MNKLKNNLGTKIGYQIFPLSFKSTNKNKFGNLKGIINKLPYLKDLGIDIIWLCPIYKSNFKDAGYDVIDYYKIDEIFGTLEDFDNLMEKAKELKIDIMMDFVINHASKDSFEFKEACKSRDNKYHDFFVWRDNPDLKNKSIFGSKSWEYVESVNQYYLHIFSIDQPDFNFESKEMREWFYKIFEFWIGKNVKYFRFDAIEHIGKTIDPYIIRYGENNLKLLIEINKNVIKNNDIYIFGESWNVSLNIMNEYSIKNKIIDSFFNFSILSLDWKNQYGSLAKIKNKVDFKNLKGYFDWQKANYETATSWTNHDVPRAIDRYFPNINGKRYYAQTALTTLLMTTKGIPFLFQGEEFGMRNTSFSKLEDFTDPQIFANKDTFIKEHNYTEEEYLLANQTGSRDLCRSIMAWNDSKNSGFTNDEVKPWINNALESNKINLEEDLSKNKNSIFKFTKSIINLRKTTMSNFFTKFNKIKIHNLESEFTIFENVYKNKGVFIAINWTIDTIIIDRKIKKIIFSNYENGEITKNVLQPFEATIYLEE